MIKQAVSNPAIHSKLAINIMQEAKLVERQGGLSGEHGVLGVFQPLTNGCFSNKMRDLREITTLTGSGLGDRKLTIMITFKFEQTAL